MNEVNRNEKKKKLEKKGKKEKPKQIVKVLSMQDMSLLTNKSLKLLSNRKRLLVLWSIHSCDNKARNSVQFRLSFLLLSATEIINNYFYFSTAKQLYSHDI